MIADQARMRRDLQPLRPGDEIAVDLRILTARRTDLVADRTRAINRLRAQLLEYFPALERAFDYSHSKAALILLTGYQTPDGLRRAGAARLEAWLRKRKARNASAVAVTAIEAANAQHTTIPGQQIAAAMVARLAKEVMALDTEIGDTDAMIEERFRRHRHAEIILSLPGFGVILGAEFIAATGGDMSAFASADRLAGVSGLAPVPRDSGRITATSNAPAATTADCCGPATCPPRSPSAPIPPPGPTTTASEPKAKPTPKPSSPWPADASTFCGPCSATTPSTSPQHNRGGLTTSLRILLGRSSGSCYRLCAPVVRTPLNSLRRPPISGASATLRGKFLRRVQPPSRVRWGSSLLPCSLSRRWLAVRSTASRCSVAGSCVPRRSARRAGSRRVNSSTITARASAGMAFRALLTESSTSPGCSSARSRQLSCRSSCGRYRPRLVGP